MIKNYFLIAWRQITKNKIYALINILGLTVGIAIYVFGSLVSNYEKTHDTFFENHERIFTAGTLFSPSSNTGLPEHDSVASAFGPVIEAEVEELEAVARVVRGDFLLSLENDHYYQGMRFVDPTFLRIFEFDYVEGDSRALDEPTGLLITKSTARKFFGEAPALGQTVTLNHRVSFHVTAVIEDLPANTHFNSALFGTKLEAVGSMAALARFTGSACGPNSCLRFPFDLAGSWSGLASGNLTYMLLPKEKTRAWLQAKLDGVYERHYPEGRRDIVTGVKVRPLVEANTLIWERAGFSLLDTITILGLVILAIAIANYTNLATAQSMGRSREIGLRKTMGATRLQLIIQFMVESLCITTISMLAALALLDVLIPAYNMAVDRNVAIDYAATLPWLLATTVGVGLAAGAFPAYVITRISPIDALTGVKGVKRGWFRGVMLGLQFTASTVMLAFVLVVYFQNQKVESAANLYPKSQIITLHRMGDEGIRSRHEALGNELIALPGVSNVSFSSQIPYLLNNSSHLATPTPGDRDAAFDISQVFVDEQFLATYDIPLLQGRDFSREVARDTMVEGVLGANVIVNELAVVKLGFASAADALNRVFYPCCGQAVPYTIIGVVPDQNFRGFISSVNPTVFKMRPGAPIYASVRVEGHALADALTEIETVWKRVIPDYPIQSEFLEDTFRRTFRFLEAATMLFGVFAFIALALSLVGLYGLSAFMAGTRTKEIGIRKVMGANTRQILNLLIWQFSKPALWALLIALPLAYLITVGYLNLYTDRLGNPVGFVIGAGALAVVLAWASVATHAFTIARASAINALRSE